MQCPQPQFVGRSERSQAMARWAVARWAVARWAVAAAAVAVVMGSPLRSRAGIDVTPRPMEHIRPGVVIGAAAPEGWTHVISVAHPRLGSGEVDQLPRLAAELAEKFSFAIVAKVGQNESGRFELQRVALGNAMEIRGQMTVVTAKTQRSLGANLGFIGGKVLEASESMLKEVQQVARYESLMVFDAPAIILIDGSHHKLFVRSVVWVNSRSGDLGTVVWLMRGSRDEGFSLVPEKKFIVHQPPNLREERVLNVDGSRIRLGIPATDAIGMARMPPGNRYPFTPEFERVAVLAKFTPQSLVEFQLQLNANLTQVTPLPSK